MKSMNAEARAQLAGILSIVTLVVTAAPAFSDGWQNDIEYESCDCGSPGNGCCCGSSPSECCAPVACDDGYCFSSPMSDELSRRMTAMAKSMEAQGFIYAPGLTQFYQGVTSGGLDESFEYGGKVDQFLILDSTKLGVWQGTTMTMHAETRFGQDVNFDAVGLSPVNVAMLYPKFDEHDTAITGLSFAQALDEDIQAIFGKFNALDLFYSLYPETGRGINGFMNASMVIPISVGRVVPLSFMGAGALKYSEKNIQGGVLAYDTQNCATTSGFDDMFDNGANILGFWRFFSDVNGLPGSHLFGGIWSTGEFASFDPLGFAIVPGQGLVVDRESGAYTLLYILEQTLWADGCNKNRNVTFLSQWGLADQATSPFGWSANVAIQTQGFNQCRPHDSLGVGYFHTGLSNDFENQLAPAFDLRDINGVELYYNAAVAKCFQLTTDFQVVEPADVRQDTAIVFGLRGTAGF